MPSHEKKTIGPAHGDQVFPQVEKAILEGWVVYGQAGYCRIGCHNVDTIEVYLMRPISKAPGECKLPESDFGAREA